jgi:hypothetical protein
MGLVGQDAGRSRRGRGRYSEGDLDDLGDLGETEVESGEDEDNESMFSSVCSSVYSDTEDEMTESRSEVASEATDNDGESVRSLSESVGSERDTHVDAEGGCDESEGGDATGKEAGGKPQVLARDVSQQQYNTQLTFAMRGQRKSIMSMPQVPYICPLSGATYVR